MPRRSRNTVLTLVAMLPAALAGCATSAIDMAPDRPDRPWVPATAADGEIIPGAKARRRKEEAVERTTRCPPIPRWEVFRPLPIPTPSTPIRSPSSLTWPSRTTC